MSYFEKKTYSVHCRLCRKHLLDSDKITFSHKKSTEACGNCLYLDENSLPDWIQIEIENSQWTKGRLKCPRRECTARVGGFDFIQGLLCGCGELKIPAVWIQESKVDVRVINSINVIPKSRPSSASGSQFSTRATAMPDVKQTRQGHSFEKQTKVLTSSFDGAPVTTSVDGYDNTNDTGTSGVISNACDIDFVQHGHCDNVNFRTAHVQQLCTSVPTTSGVSKIMPQKIALKKTLIEQNKECVKPVEIKFELAPKATSNRFNTLTVEEPETLKLSCKPSSQENIHEHLICAICLDYYYKPYQCPCGHTFCESCLRQLYHNRAGTLTCPICRSPVRYIEPVNEIREELHKLCMPEKKRREEFEKKAKYRQWPLPPIGHVHFLRKRQTLVPLRDQTLLKLASVLLLVVCYAILYILQ